MQLVHFPGCCTAQVLVGFGQSDTAALGYRPHREYTEETFYNEAKRLLEQAGRHNYATVIAITNSDQTTAMKVLPKLGFVLVQQEIGKRQHEDKTLNTYVYTVTGADKKPLPVPANPFAKKEEAVPAQGLREGVVHVRIPVQRPVQQVVRVSAEEVEAYRNKQQLLGTRRQINERLFAAMPRRDEQGRFVSIPQRGHWYTSEEARQFRNLPVGLLYAVITGNSSGIYWTRKISENRVVDTYWWNHNDTFILFA